MAGRFESCILEATMGTDSSTSCSAVILDGIFVIAPILPIIGTSYLSGQETTLVKENMFTALQRMQLFVIRDSKDTNYRHFAEGQLSLLNCLENKHASIRNKASVLLVWNFISFYETLKRLMPKEENWKLSMYNHELPDNKVQNENSANKIARFADNKTKDVYSLLKCLSIFAVLKLSSSIGTQELESFSDVTEKYFTKIEKTLVRLLPLLICNSSKLVGEKVVVVGTPFGSLCPDVFMNSLSQGIISNVAGENGEVILTDARCTPGTEGGILYVGEAVRSLPSWHNAFGMVVIPIAFKGKEMIGLTVACSLSGLLLSLKGHVESLLNKSMESAKAIVTVSESKVARVRDYICFIRSGNTWGSGVLLDEGVILTCSHVVRHSLTYGQVPEGELFDLAILHLMDAPTPGIPISDVVPKQGSHVMVVGHSLFDDYLDLPPSFFAGIVSRVVFQAGIPVMIQTTCAVHPGVSGGALIDSSLALMGIICCNCRDNINDVSYPHVNFAIPLSAILPFIKLYHKCKDTKVFESLHVFDQKVKSLWNLKSLPHSKL